jgi:transposase-like protein
MGKDTKKRKQYDEDFKRETVRELLLSGKSVNEYAKISNVNRINLQKWKQHFAPENKSEVLEHAEISLQTKVECLSQDIAELKDTVACLRDIVKRNYMSKYLDNDNKPSNSNKNCLKICDFPNPP